MCTDWLELSLDQKTRPLVCDIAITFAQIEAGNFNALT